eukprot:15206319-Alexandrium_andersonii.AAC.1
MRANATTLRRPGCTTRGAKQCRASRLIQCVAATERVPTTRDPNLMRANASHSQATRRLRVARRVEGEGQH